MRVQSRQQWIKLLAMVSAAARGSLARTLRLVAPLAVVSPVIAAPTMHQHLRAQQRVKASTRVDNALEATYQAAGSARCLFVAQFRKVSLAHLRRALTPTLSLIHI